MVEESQPQHESQWAAIVSIAGKIGCTPETLRRWVRQHERDSGRREGLTTQEQQRIKDLEREKPNRRDGLCALGKTAPSFLNASATLRRRQRPRNAAAAGFPLGKI